MTGLPPEGVQRGSLETSIPRWVTVMSPARPGPQRSAMKDLLKREIVSAGLADSRSRRTWSGRAGTKMSAAWTVRLKGTPSSLEAHKAVLAASQAKCEWILPGGADESRPASSAPQRKCLRLRAAMASNTRERNLPGLLRKMPPSFAAAANGRRRTGTCIHDAPASGPHSTPGGRSRPVMDSQSWLRPCIESVTVQPRLPSSAISSRT